MTTARREYDIILGAQNGKPIEDYDPPLNEEEIKEYHSIVEQCEKIRATGREPMFELPIDAFDDEEGIEDIYPDDFDKKVMEIVERRDRRIKHIRSVE